MIAELPENIAGWDKIQGALDEIRACQEQAAHFFAGVCDELDSLGAALIVREKVFEKQSALRENALAAVNAAAADNHSDELFQKLAEERMEICRSQHVMQEQLAQEREAFAAELHDLRRQTVEMAASLTEQQRTATQQQNLWTENFQHIQNVLANLTRQFEETKGQPDWSIDLQTIQNSLQSLNEQAAESKQSPDWSEDLQEIQNSIHTLLRQFKDTEPQSDASQPLEPPSAVAAVASGDPVLESVVAQFEILQRDRLRRRPANGENAPQDNT